MKHLTKKWLCLLLSFYASFSFAQVNVQDSLELIRFYHDVCIDCPLVWDFSQPVETWEGITIIDGHVKEIRLNDKYLDGTLGDWNFPELWELRLYDNNLTGYLIDFTGMNSLRYFDIDDNQLIGEIPDFTNLLNLDYFELEGNQLSGDIPNFTRMFGLRELYLDNNQLTGVIPDFTNLYNLEVLDIEINDLSGEIPNFTDLPNLKELYIGYNNLTGAIPDFTKLDSLEILDIGRNNLCNTIPNFSNLPKLKELYINENNLIGNIPDFANLSSLEELTIYDNYEIIGAIPDFNLPQLTRLTIGRTSVSAAIPNFSGISNLTYLDLGINYLTGCIPNFSLLTNLERLDLHGNELTGNIPDFNIPTLERIFLYSNELTGAIPTFENLPKLQRLNLSNNELTDTIPHFTNPLLEDILLYDNQLIGSIPDFTTLPNIEKINLSENLLSGCYPDNFNQFCNATIDEINFTDNIGLPNEGDISLFCNNGLGTCAYSSETDSLELIYFYENACAGCTFWDLSQPFDTWQGVVTNTDRRVTELVLPKMNLNGELVDLNLSELQRVDLDTNQLAGNLPLLSNAKKLIHLSLSHNLFEDEIPNYDLPELVDLHLNENQLGRGPWFTTISSGNIQESDIPNFKLPNLESLVLSDNQLKGAIPDFNNLPKLKTLSLFNNLLTSNIPDFDSMPNLEVIMLFNNDLNGSVPSFSSQSNLYILLLDNNGLSGCFSSDVQNLCNVFYVSMGGNYLPGGGDFQSFCANGSGQCSGAVSVTDSLELVRFYNETCNEGCSLNWDLESLVNTWTGVFLSGNRVAGLVVNNVGLSGTLPNLNLSRLEELNLSYNSLTGQIPDFSQADSLAILHLNSNDFRDTIPDFNLPRLFVLGLDDNDRLEGELPYFGALDSLLYLKISDTNISGSIPNYSNFPNLYTLDLSVNRLTGQIPNFNLPQLCTLDLSSNRSLGSTLPDFDSLPMLKILNLRYDRLTGSIPDFQSLDSLEILSLSNNELTGAIPNFSNLPKLRELSVTSNHLSDSIPAFSDIPELTYLGLGNNEFVGGIPDFPNFPKLERLLLYGNDLSGTIPDLTYLDSLEYLSLDDNNLSGTIPDLSSLSKLQRFDIEENYFTFDKIQDYLTVNNLTEFDYSPQYHGTVQAYSPEGGDTLTLALSAPLPGNNNDNANYEWKKNYDEDEETTVGTDSTHTIEDFQLSDVGIYTAHITDATRVPDLEIISKPIYVRKAGYDLLGEPVTYSQLMVEFEDKNAQQRYEEEYLWPGSGIRADACDCNRLLYLWQFPNENIAYDIFIDINTKTENQGESAVVDGGFNNIVKLDSIPTFRRWTWTGDYSDTYKDSVLVFLLDSGTDIQNWNANRYMLNEASIDSCYEINAAPGYDYTDTLNSINTDFRDSLGHGTFGMRSIAEDSDFMDLNVVPLKIFNKQGQGTLFNFVCALYHAIDHGADIINISAGYSGTPSDILESAVAFAKQKGVFIVTAAGNDTTDIDIRPQYPAYYAKIDTLMTEDTTLITGYDNVISVASMSPTNDLSGFSNYGKKAVTLAAYGEDMAGHLHTGELASRSGSSIATYYVTRQLASVIAEDRERPYQQVWQDFENNQLRSCPTIEDLTSTGKCLDITLNEIYGDFNVYLEGAYNSNTQKMNTNLFTLNLLPGQENNPDNRQPYHVSPFNYQGNEQANIYPDSIVDWVLVSLRTDTLPESQVAQTAAWLTENGRIELLKPLSDSLNVNYDSVYVVIEHRNHMAVMSSEKIPARRNLMSWDFTLQNSFARGGTGQKELILDVWGMLAGDGQHSPDGYDINGGDKIIWSDTNGQFLLYLLPDYNMDGDVNGADRIIWENNNGRFSAVRR